MVFFFQDSEVENLYKQIPSYLNLTVFGPQKAIINGNLGEWEYIETDLKPNEKKDYWDEANAKFKLGDFNELVKFLISNSGRQDAIENAVK